MNRLALGTVQLGLPYGIANRSGQPSGADAASIIERAAAAGMDTLDTAISYGESEQRLGEIGISGWRVITKLPRMPADAGDVGDWVLRSVESSLRRLRLGRIAGLLLHDAAELSRPHGPALAQALIEVKSRSLVEKIGVSAYGPDEIELAQGRLPLDLVQAPMNVLDRRLATSGWLEQLQAGGTEVHVRSAFLQGLLLMPADSRPASFDRWRPLLRRWDDCLAQAHVSPLQACLGFLLSHAQISRVVVGVDTPTQCDEIAAAAARPPVPLPAELECDDPDLINPARWNRQ